MNAIELKNRTAFVRGYTIRRATQVLDAADQSVTSRRTQSFEHPNNGQLRALALIHVQKRIQKISVLRGTKIPR